MVKANFDLKYYIYRDRGYGSPGFEGPYVSIYKKNTLKIFSFIPDFT